MGQQKLRDVARAVKGLSVVEMRTQLGMLNKDAARRILETLNQAVANAQHNHGVSEDKLVVKELLVLRGPHYKRFRAVSRGQGHAILKRTSHIVVTLAVVEEQKPATEIAQKVEKRESKPEVKPEPTAEKKSTSTKKTTKKTNTKKVTKAKKTQE